MRATEKAAYASYTIKDVKKMFSSQKKNSPFNRLVINLAITLIGIFGIGIFGDAQFANASDHYHAHLDNDSDNRPTSSSIGIQRSLKLFQQDAIKAAQRLIDETPQDDRARLQYQFFTEQRVRGTDQTNTPSFCAVLAWCEPWGIKQVEMSQPQLEAMHKLLSTVLSTGGYHTFMTLMNRHQMLGELENVSTASVIQEIVDKCPSIRGNTLAELIEKCFEVTSTDRYTGLGGAFKPDPVTGEYIIRWPWNPPGLDIRRQQFDNFSIALFGELGAEDWGLRFEGHHVTVNIHFHNDPETGEILVSSTPAFYGSSPIIVPEDPGVDTNTNWNWTKGQTVLFREVEQMRGFWLALPERLRISAFIDSENFYQEGVLRVETFPPTLLSSLDPVIDTTKIDQFPNITIKAKHLPDEAKWRLEEVFKSYLGSMPSAVAAQYQERINKALRGNGEITMAWAGGDLDDINSQHASYIEVAGMLLELQQNNQFTVQDGTAFENNHLHSALRDLKHPWDFDPIDRHYRHHMH